MREFTPLSKKYFFVLISIPSLLLGLEVDDKPITNVPNVEEIVASQEGIQEGGPLLDEHKDVVATQDSNNFGGGFAEGTPLVDEHKDIVQPEGTTTKPGIYISPCSDQKYEQKFDVKITGFIKFDCFFDTRQNENYTFGLVLVAPKEPIYDPAGNDINDAPQWNMLALQSRLNVDVIGPRIGTAKTMARFSMDFTNPDPDTVASIFMRFAHMQFDWDFSKEEKLKVLIGEYYHPISLDECYPDTLGYNQGTLFDPFTYAPQITARYTYGKLSLVGSLNADWFYTPARNSALPDWLLGGHIKFNGENFVGAGVDYHREVPRLVTDTGYATSHALGSYCGWVFAAFNKNGKQLKLRFTYLENGIKYTMLGGTAVRAKYFNPITHQGEYTNLRALAAWTELIWRRKKGEFGLFMGYTKNIGSRHRIVTLPDGTADFSFIQTLYPAAARTNTVVNFQPRIKFYLDPLIFGVEMQYLRATYGKVDDHGRVFDAKPTDMARFELAIFYNF